MHLTPLLARHLREVFFGGNWTGTHLQETLESITFAQARAAVPFTPNTIAVLVFHLYYYIRETTKVLEGGLLEAHDKYSFDAPSLSNEADWVAFRQEVYSAAERFAQLVEQLPDERLQEHLADPKYGSYYRNIQGIVEHTHYHLGQIVLLRKALPKEL